MLQSHFPTFRAIYWGEQWANSTRRDHICCWKPPLEGRKNCTLWRRRCVRLSATWRSLNALLNGNRQVALTGIFLLGMHDDLYESGGTPCNNQGHLHFHLSDKKSLNFFYLQNKVFERKQLLVFWLLLPVWIARKTGVTPAVALKQLYLQLYRQEHPTPDNENAKSLTSHQQNFSLYYVDLYRKRTFINSQFSKESH